MPDVYERRPVYENELIRLRPLEKDDAEALLQCYADPYAAPIFNADNCDDDFRYHTLEQMQKAVDFWLYCYENRFFLRWTIVDQALDLPIGTVEMFHKEAEDGVHHTGVLRLDLRSSHETRGYVNAVLAECVRHFYEDFNVVTIYTKAVPTAVERRVALEACGFEPLAVGPFGKDDYFARSVPVPNEKG